MAPSSSAQLEKNRKSLLLYSWYTEFDSFAGILRHSDWR